MNIASVVCCCVVATVSTAAQVTVPWLSWSRAQAEQTVKANVERGRIAGGRRLLNTERAHSYKLMATWFTPEVLQASARLLQLRDRLPNDEAEKALSEAQRPDETTIMVELDPNEGSGVIPLDWQAVLQPRNQPQKAVVGVKQPAMRDIRVAAGVSVRNYDYDRFWVTFPTRTPSGDPLFVNSDREAELVVRIYEREGRVTWPIPASMR